MVERAERFDFQELRVAVSSSKEREGREGREGMEGIEGREGVEGSESDVRLFNKLDCTHNPNTLSARL